MALNETYATAVNDNGKVIVTGSSSNGTNTDYVTFRPPNLEGPMR